MRLGHGDARTWRALRTLSPAALAFAACLPVGAPPACAEDEQVTVVLHSGERIDGTLVKSDLDHVYVRLLDTSHNQSITAILTYDRARIRRIEEASPSLPEYASRRAELPDTARAHRELARWCVDAELLPQAREEAVRAEQLRHDADTETLLLRLGMTYADGAWQDLDAYLARSGRVRYAGTIMSQEEAFRLQERASDDQAFRDTIAAISDDQALLAAVAREREALEARARALSAALAAASDELLRAQAAVRRWHELNGRDGAHDGDDGTAAAALADIQHEGQAAVDAMPALRTRHAELQRDVAAVPAERAALDEREQEIRASLTAAESRLMALRGDDAGFGRARAH